ncbi:uncharacterized protein PITG_02599 [Phytophthora infestans T30-4]|uniref:Uncharacterized protein n=1 Tax=Phytophthora infestans (strain T30-4) TaxID=403677 RepID=D0MWR6_PHYIT|nr:uncharacterized protein PITG_02599 [Phytophthora infestans T30-4]EEY64079.1 conserved hypothetical protein [Phytophthora infestans T30-4]|eukprot:XP_002907515.1 conserved hypothetical protein [Phytophthora infestans T30-4]
MAGASPKKNGSAPQTPKQSPPHSSPTPSPSRGPDDVDADELTALIKAVKFAHPGFGVKRVHDQVLSHGGKFARVPFKRVKRYMHKLGMNSPSEEDKTPVKLMTVGGDAKSLRDGGPEASGATDDMVWLPVKLDEPASKLQEFPYQAVIRMTTNEEGDAEGSLGEIYKIQVAVESDGSLSTISPYAGVQQGAFSQDVPAPRLTGLSACATIGDRAGSEGELLAAPRPTSGAATSRSKTCCTSTRRGSHLPSCGRR